MPIDRLYRLTDAAMQPHPYLDVVTSLCRRPWMRHAIGHVAGSWLGGVMGSEKCLRLLMRGRTFRCPFLLLCAVAV